MAIGCFTQGYVIQAGVLRNKLVICHYKWSKKENSTQNAVKIIFFNRY